MKRLWLAFLLLGGLFLLSLFHIALLNRLTISICDRLDTAVSAAEQEDWPSAEQYTAAAVQQWNRWESYLHITLRHTDTDHITGLFAEMQEIIRRRDRRELSAARGQLTLQLRALYKSECPTPENIF